MWSRVRHRRLQALSLVALAALLTTSLGLGPLYQRAMEQALAGSTLEQVTTAGRAIAISSVDRSLADLEGELPAGLTPYFGAPVETRAVSISVKPVARAAVMTRLYAPDDVCEHIRIVTGACPSAPGQVAVSVADADVNGWVVGSRVKVREHAEPGSSARPGKGDVSVVGTYEADDDGWIGTPITGRAGTSIVDGSSSIPVTDDWLSVPGSFDGQVPARWGTTSQAVTWPLDASAVGVDELLRLGPRVQRLEDGTAGTSISVVTDLPALAAQVASGRDQGRVTVVVLVAQLLVLVAVVLWMVLAAATDDRRRELALVRLRGRGRGGATRFLLAELLPLCWGGVLIGVVLAPLVMAAVSRVVFPVPVPVELPAGYLLAALGAALAVVAVVVAAAVRAAREPVDSLLRGVRGRRAGAGIGEVVATVFSLTAVVALLTGTLEGPLATLAPTLLALAAGLVLGRALGPVTQLVSRLLLARGRAVAAAGILNAVRRPSARRVLVMVIVAVALVVFCCDALVTGRHNRQNAAEQAHGAPYVLELQTDTIQPVVDAVSAVDPDRRHLTPVVSSRPPGASTGATVAVDPTAFARLAQFPLGGGAAVDWSAILAPSTTPVRLTGTELSGSLDVTEVVFGGVGRRDADVKLRAQVLRPDGDTDEVTLAQVPEGTATVPIAVAVDCPDGCVLTGFQLATPPGLEARGTLTPHDLSVDGRPLDLGGPDDWRATTDDSLRPVTDTAGRFAVKARTPGSLAPPLTSRWVPDPVPALVSAPSEKTFSAAGLEAPTPMRVAGRIARVPGAAPGARIVDLAGLLRQTQVSVLNDSVAVWGDDAGEVRAVRAELARRGVTVVGETTTAQVRRQLDSSPAAWSLALSVLVGGASVLVAALVMLVATATSWRARATDLAALRMAGLPDPALRRMELIGQLPVVLVGGLAGAVCGVVAGVVALPGIRQFTVVPAVDTTDFSTRWVVVVVAALAVVVVLGLLATATTRWTARRARLERIREVV